MHVVSAFGLVYLSGWFGYWGIMFVLAPIGIGFLWGVRHFEKLEKQSNIQPTVYSAKSNELKPAG